MKIAVAAQGNIVSQHFGHCQGFVVYTVEENKSLEKSFLPNAGHRPGFLPVFLKEQGVNVVIAGGMGENAQKLFGQNNIEVIVGVQGYCDDLVQEYVKGNLQSSGAFCREHQSRGSCHS